VLNGSIWQSEVCWDRPHPAGFALPHSRLSLAKHRFGIVRTALLKLRGKPKRMSKELNVGTEVKVTELKAAHPEWSLYVNPRQRTLGATGKVVGFYRTSKNELFAITHSDGTAGVYEADELE
jgi:hypothetical protein